jgi:transposase InsO family protein
VLVARKVTSMKVITAVIAAAEGAEVNVSATCQMAGVSRKTFYKWLARYRAEGLAGLEERSRQPRRVPHRVDPVIEDAVVRWRKQLLEEGLDHGPTTIQWHLGRDADLAGRVPSVATIYRILARRGQITAQPTKRPRASWCRFEAPAPNEWWQIDATDWVTAHGVVRIFNIIDDHSRLAVRSRAVTEATGAHAWTTFCQAAATWGLPAGVLSDNGLCFSGRLRGIEVLFERNLRDVGVRPFTGRPHHPQTTGKVERFQQTLKRWLRRQPLAANLTVLQQQLDAFCEIYNHHRPHQGIRRVTPITRWTATPPSRPAQRGLPRSAWPTQPHDVVVRAVGTVRVETSRTFRIHIGVEHNARRARIFIDNHHATVFVNNTLVRHLELDHTRDYQPSGGPRHRPRQPA